MQKRRNDQPQGRPRPATAADDKVAQLERLIEVMVSKDVVEVELEEGGTRWRVRRKEPHTVAYTAPPQMAMPQAAHASAVNSAAAAAHAPPAAKEPQGEVFKSPMLGTFYRA